MEIQGSLDDEIEVNFSVSPSVRELRYHDPKLVTLREDLMTMWVTPSIRDTDFHRWFRESFMADFVLEAGQTATCDVEMRPGWQDVFSPELHALTYVVGRDEGPSEIDLELFDGQMLPEQIQVKTGMVRVRVHSRVDSAVRIGVGYLGDDDDAHPEPVFTIEPFVTGKRMLTSQTFRSLFRTESVEVGTGMQLRSLTVLFTDLQASTAMYERVGDMNALGIVQRHFEILEATVAENQGAVVKTIGDAVMAVFAEPHRAMEAAASMIDVVRRAVAHGEDLTLKIGLHHGPSVAIQNNGQLDYFGRTVNLAARAQALAEGGQIVCSRELWDAPGVQDVIQRRGLSSRSEDAKVKGIAERFPVQRIFVLGEAEPARAKTPRQRKAAAPPKRASRKVQPRAAT